MNTIEVDTKKMEDIIKDLADGINEYEEDIEELYAEIADIKEVWRGPDFELFLSERLSEKPQFLELIMVLNQYKECLIKKAIKMEERSNLD